MFGAVGNNAYICRRLTNKQILWQQYIKRGKYLLLMRYGR